MALSLIAAIDLSSDSSIDVQEQITALQRLPRSIELNDPREDYSAQLAIL